MLYGPIIEPMHHIHSRNVIHICILSFKLPFQSEYDALIGSVGPYSIEITTTTTKILQKVLASSTCSVVKGPPYFDLP